MAPPPTDLLGRLAIHYNMITREQLAEATRAHGGHPSRRLGDVLLAKGFVSEHQLRQLLEAERTMLRKRADRGSQRAAPRPAQAPPVPAGRPSHAQRALAQARDRLQPEVGQPLPPPPPPGPRAPSLPPAPTEPEDSHLARTLTGEPIPDKPLSQEADPRRDWLHRVLSRAVADKASDVHIHPGNPVRVRLLGELADLGAKLLSREHTESVLGTVLDDSQWQTLHREGEVDLAYSLPGVGRFRGNVFIETQGVCAVFHCVPAQPPTLSELGLPGHLERLASYHNGIILLTGPSGCGKTSTMAALMSVINQERSDHLLSIEDPIEYIHRSRRCIVNQRQVHRHTKSFAAALRSALREDPDILCIGELRDLETISLAMSAAETGHLVLGTMHTLGAVRSINRLVGAFPAAQQSQIRTMLSDSLRAVVSQQLLPRKDGSGRVPALELLVINQAAANLIRENKTFQLPSILQTGRAEGMCSMDDSLLSLVREGEVEKTVAVQFADNPQLFR